MATPQRTQKSIAERFKGNLDYYKKAHYLRRAKFLVTSGVVVVGLAAMALWQFYGGEKFYSSGTITRPHAQFANQCEKCHVGGNTVDQIKASFRTGQRSLALSAMDEACLKCHKGFSFHMPNVVQSHSCVACHHEHTGSGPMSPPADRNCQVCHGDAAIMQASLEKGKTLPPEAFDDRASQGADVFKTPQPERSHPQCITAFAIDHPEFQLIADKLRDPDTLKFNHQLHLTSPTIPQLPNGKKLECADCHQPDASGGFYRKISFEANCQVCHSLQFDAENPALRVPHGNAEFVRAFLRSLPAQYAEHAKRVKNLTTTDDVNAFVQAQMARLRAQVGSGEQLEREIFFSNARTGPSARVAGMDATGRARFPGCAYCHEVTASGDAPPQITKPVIMDRWLVRGGFNHAKHTQVACEKCHDVRGSKDTADILLPSKNSCAVCHSPKGGVPSNCSECHQYHAKR